MLWNLQSWSKIIPCSHQIRLFGGLSTLSVTAAQNISITPRKTFHFINIIITTSSYQSSAYWPSFYFLSTLHSESRRCYTKLQWTWNQREIKWKITPIDIREDFNWVRSFNDCFQFIIARMFLTITVAEIFYAFRYWKNPPLIDNVEESLKWIFYARNLYEWLNVCGKLWRQ